MMNPFFSVASGSSKNSPIVSPSVTTGHKFLFPPLFIVLFDCLEIFRLFDLAFSNLKLRLVMDPKHTGDILKHLEKQNELLTQSHSSMSYELHKLQVEEEMLMRKFYELMEAQRQNKENQNSDEISDKNETKAIVVGPICGEDDETGEDSAAFVSSRSKGTVVRTEKACKFQ